MQLDQLQLIVVQLGWLGSLFNDNKATIERHGGFISQLKAMDRLAYKTECTLIAIDRNTSRPK